MIVEGLLVSATPCFIGADPARSPLLGGGELAPLQAIEEMARSLVETLTDSQLRQALLHPSAPSDIVSGNRPRLSGAAEIVHINDPGLWRQTVDEPRRRQRADAPREVVIRPQPNGLAAAEMTTAQRTLLHSLVSTHEACAPEGVLAKSPSSLVGIHFAWAGDLEAGRPHYYRLHSPELLVEYDNTQNNANHIHSVWRDPANDWGEDLLREHYEGAHPAG